MSYTSDNFISSLKDIKPSSGIPKTFSDHIVKKLMEIEFFNTGDYPDIIASAKITFPIVRRTKDKEEFINFFRNTSILYTLARESMMAKANDLCLDKKVKLTTPGDLLRVFHQKKLSRTIMRASLGEEAYGEYVVELTTKKEKKIDTLVEISLMAFIHKTNNESFHGLLFKASAVAQRLDPESKMYKFEKVIEHLF